VISKRTAGLACALLLAAPALGFVPAADRVVRAIGETNRASGRGEALQIELEMSIGGRDPVATGDVVTHPTGLARLELRGAGNLIERHLLQGSEHSAARGGQRIQEPWYFLPPWFLLQAGSSVTLGAALSSLGVQADAVALAPCGERDCYVLGDPSRAAPPLAPTDEVPAIEEGISLAPLFVQPRQGRDPTIWVDTSEFQLRRIDRGDGVQIFLGPPAAFGKVRLPSWVAIQQPGRPEVRFEVLAATPVTAPAAGFSESWLFALPPETAGRSGPPGKSAPSRNPSEADF